LAAGQYQKAADEFTASARQFAEATKPAEEQMARAYEKLARRIEDAKDANRAAALKRAIEALETSGHEDAKFFAEQIRTAEQAFAK
jgi:hypothetical protein